MRAVFVDTLNIDLDQQIVIAGDKGKHLIQVLRVKEKQEILILNGCGLRAMSIIESVSKREVQLRVLKLEKIDLSQKRFSLAIGQLKKEAMDSVLRSSCELGFSEILIIETEYSQKYKLNEQRAQKILISALEQSNLAYLPKLRFLKIEELLKDSYKHAFVFATEGGMNFQVRPEITIGQNLLIIGPEGGFSNADLATFKALPNMSFCQIDTPIMRAPTAVNCCLGYLKAFC